MARISRVTIESNREFTPEEKAAKSKLVNQDPVFVAKAIDYYARRNETKPLVPERGTDEWFEVQRQLVTPVDKRVPAKFGIHPFFRWYDLWIGAYYDRHNRTLYICPLPTIGVAIQFAG
jgi:hypothetical protein